MLDQCAVTVEENRRLPHSGTFCQESFGEEISSIALSKFQRFMGSDVAVIATPCPASHPADESREDFKAEVERFHLGDFPIGSSINDVESRIGEVAGWCFRLLDEGDDSSVRVQLGNSTSGGVRRLEQNHRQRIGVLSMECDQRPQVDVAEVVSVDNDDLVYIIGEIRISSDGAGRAQEYWFVRLDQE